MMNQPGLETTAGCILLNTPVLLRFWSATVVLALSFLVQGTTCAVLAPSKTRLSLLARGRQPSAWDLETDEDFHVFHADRQMGGSQNFQTDGSDVFEKNFWHDESQTNLYRFMDSLEPVAPLDRLTENDKVEESNRLAVPSESSLDMVVRTGVRDGYQQPVFVPSLLRPGAFPLAETPPNNSGALLGYRRGGLLSPSDAFPLEAYPLQSHSDQVNLVPPTAREDRIPKKLAKYMEQVEGRMAECDNVSPECTTTCQKGDTVDLYIGSAKISAQVISAHVGNVLRVQYSPASGVSPSDGSPAPSKALGEVCGLQASCSLFRPCYSGGGNVQKCVSQEDHVTKNHATDTIEHTLRCPVGTSLCKSVDHFVLGSYARLGEKACQNAVPGFHF